MTFADLTQNEVLMAALVGGCAMVTYRVYAVTRKAPLPPGPKGWPIIGNLLDVPKTFQWLKHAEWHKQYGPIVSLNLLGHTIIYLHNADYVNEISQRRHAAYSHSPKWAMLCEMVGWDRITVFMSPDAVWKEHRKNFSKLFGSKAAVAKFYGVEMFEVRRFMRNILREKDKLQDHIRYWTGSLSLKIAYGYETKAGHDEFVELVDETMLQFSVLNEHHRYLVNFLPWMKYLPAWFPGGGFKRTAEIYRNSLTEMIDTPFKMVQEQLKSGAAKQSFTSDILCAEDYTEEREFSLKTSAASIYAGGADTTAGQLHGILLLMLLNEEVQKKAQQEIDAVIGAERLPDYGDRVNLPYVEACITEAMRLHTLVPFGGVRVVLEDDNCNGYLLPKGAIIMPNIWEILHDPKTYPNPHEYIPERWLVENPPIHPREFAFGFGRRSCPGMHLADHSLWLATTMFLALFDIKPTEGSPTFFDYSDKGVLSGLPICHPKPYKCDIRTRNPKTEALILSFDNEL
ncbi:cytochrome P450 [Cristinia sonorae]|uniref:Cytochrome P450 n=1 Tax=Cristinia sonorae TaxID=1940300 RepID=A0A8K0UCR5_9AGAR|nr:cytochrome P450 [Cristinia sonorae]